MKIAPNTITLFFFWFLQLVHKHNDSKTHEFKVIPKEDDEEIEVEQCNVTCLEGQERQNKGRKVILFKGIKVGILVYFAKQSYNM